MTSPLIEAISVSKTFVATQATYEFKIQSLLPEVTPDDTATLVDDVHLERAP